MKESKCQLALLLGLKIFNVKLVGKAIGYMISVFGLGLIIIGLLAFSDPQSVQYANDFDPFGVPPSFLQILEYIAIGVALTAFGLWLLVRRKNQGVSKLDMRPKSYLGMKMSKHPIFTMPFAKVYPLYVQKAERKNRTKNEVNEIICWLTGYDQVGFAQQIELENDFETFFAQAPAIHPNSSLIKGVVCGVRVEDVDDPLMQKIRYLDKLIDELAKGKSMEKILRQ